MQWTVSRRISVGFGASLFLLVVTLTVAIVTLRTTTTVYDALLRTAIEQRVTGERAVSDFWYANVEYLTAVLRPADDVLRSRDSLVALTRTMLTDLRDASTVVADRQIWNQGLTQLQEWDDSVRATIRFSQQGRQVDAFAMHFRVTRPRRIALRTTIESGVAKIRASADSAAMSARAQTGIAQVALLGAGLVILAVGIVVAWKLNQAVTQPLRETSAVLASGSAEILAATTQLAAGSAETSAAVSETVTTLEEVSQTATQAAQRAKEVADRSGRAAEIGRAGRQAIEASETGVQGVRTQVESIAASILALAEQAQAIGEIIASVNDVAEQTNLLALNAAVEAARAGEHGRGFAVVAGEIRSLAAESKKATVQVRQILGEIQRATGSAVMTTEQGTKQVAAVTAQVKEAGETIRRLADSVADAAQAGAQIAASAGQQAAGMDQVRQAMGSIREAMQQNLASTRQTEQAAHDLNTLGAKLVTLVGGNHRAPAGGVRA